MRRGVRRRGLRGLCILSNHHMSMRSIIRSSSNYLSPRSYSFLSHNETPQNEKKEERDKKERTKRTLRQLCNLILCNLTEPFAGSLDTRVEAFGELGACACEVDASQAGLEL